MFSHPEYSATQREFYNMTFEEYDAVILGAGFGAVATLIRSVNDTVLHRAMDLTPK